MKWQSKDDGPARYLIRDGLEKQHRFGDDGGG